MSNPIRQPLTNGDQERYLSFNNYHENGSVSVMQEINEIFQDAVNPLVNKVQAINEQVDDILETTSDQVGVLDQKRRKNASRKRKRKSLCLIVSGIATLALFGVGLGFYLRRQFPKPLSDNLLTKSTFHQPRWVW